MTDKELQDIRDWYNAAYAEWKARRAVVPRTVCCDASVEWFQTCFDATQKLLDEVGSLKAESKCAYIVTHATVLTPLYDEIERLKAERQWISVKDRMPEPDDEVLAFYKNRSILDAFGSELHSNPSIFTHWMPLPAPPPAM